MSASTTMISTPTRVDRFIFRLPAGGAAPGAAPGAAAGGAGAAVAVAVPPPGPPSVGPSAAPSLADPSAAPFVGSDIVRPPPPSLVAAAVPSPAGGHDHLVAGGEAGQHLGALVADHPRLELHRPLAVELLHGHRRPVALTV